MVCTSEQRRRAVSVILSYMATTNRPTEFRRVILKIERDLVAQAQLRALLAVADKTVADDRQTLRTVKARMQRARRSSVTARCPERRPIR